MDFGNRLMGRMYTTYLARLHSSKRLAARGQIWNIALISLTSASLLASIGTLTDADLFGPQSSTVLLCLTAAATVLSLAVSALDYSGRSRSAKSNYLKVQRLSCELELVLETTPGEVNLSAFSDRYHEILSESENQSNADYWNVCEHRDYRGWKHFRGHRPHLKLIQGFVTYAPLIVIAVPVAILYRLASWALDG